MKNRFLKKNKGFTIIETLVAILIFSVSILGILSVMASGVTNVNYAKNKMIAEYLAQEGIEYMRNMRDTDALYQPNGTGFSVFQNELTSCTSSAPCGFDNSIAPGPSSTFTACSGTACLLYFNNGSYNFSHALGSSSGFTREVWINLINSNEIQIFSGVYWPQGSTTQKIIFSETLYNWIQ
jgi:type II secretory pathway pseudopilin PulG